MSEVERCDQCDGKLKYNRVSVAWTRHVVTKYEAGYPYAGEDRPRWGGEFCSPVCAGEALARVSSTGEKEGEE